MKINSLSTKQNKESTYVVNFINPSNGEPLEHDDKPMYAVVVGKNSQSFATSSSRLVNNAKQAEKFGKQDFSLDAEKVKTANLLASCTKELVYFDDSGWVEIKIEDKEASLEQHRKIKNTYLEYSWMAKQIDEAIGSDANFLGKSKTNSPDTLSTGLGSTSSLAT